MPITLGSNIAALRAQRALDKSSEAQSRVFERLSSGLRINHASDDAAGLAISSKLTADARVFTQGMRNIGDGISLLGVAEGAVSSLRELVTRQQELATQAANGVYSSTQRSALNTEFQALAAEYNRIVQSVSFNGMKLLDQTFGSSSVQAGYSAINFSLGAGLAQITGDGTFQTAAGFASGLAFPTRVVAADFNQDGYLDVVTTAQATSTMIRLANSDGTFKAPVSYAKANGAYYGDLSVGDVNGDGLTDLISSDYYAQSVSVLLSNGNGSFKSPIASAIGANTSTHLLTDLNSDGRLDLIVNDSATTVALLYGNGNGTFTRGPSYTSGGSATGIAYADATGDGYADLFVASGSAYVSLLVANANGTFSAPLSIALGGGVATARSIVVGDFNSDGKIDFAATRPSSPIGVRLGNGNGTFLAQSTYQTSASEVVGELLALDLNSDGALDFVSTAVAGAINVLLGNSDGTFKADITYTTPVFPRDVFAADMNRDGAIDLVTADNAAASFSILYANTRAISDEPSMNIRTVASALSAMTTLGTLQNQISTELSNIGSVQSRFYVALSNLEATRENYLGAANRIQDADVAQEAAELVRQQILQQVGAAVLAQATLQPAIALKLLAVN